MILPLKEQLSLTSASYSRSSRDELSSCTTKAVLPEFKLYCRSGFRRIDYEG